MYFWFYCVKENTLLTRGAYDGRVGTNGSEQVTSWKRDVGWIVRRVHEQVDWGKVLRHTCCYKRRHVCGVDQSNHPGVYRLWELFSKNVQCGRCERSDENYPGGMLFWLKSLEILKFLRQITEELV